MARNRVAREQRADHPLSTVTASAFSPDGTIFAIGHRDGLIQMWDAETLRLRAAPQGHLNVVRHLAFSPDGSTLVSDSADGTVRLWDATTGEDLLVLPRPMEADLSQPHFAPDGRTLGFCALNADETWLYLVPTALPAEVESEESP
jgi:WD40 repeat protein